MTWGDAHYGTYATTRRHLDLGSWIGTDDTYPDELDALLDDAEDTRNDRSIP